MQLGCNIHDQMVAFILVVDTPWAAKIGAEDGVAEIAGAPDGKVKVTVWHPYATTKDQTVTAGCDGRRQTEPVRLLCSTLRSFTTHH